MSLSDLLASIMSWLRPEPIPEPPATPPSRPDREALLRAIQEQHNRALTDLAQELDPDAQRLLRSLFNDHRFREWQNHDDS